MTAVMSMSVLALGYAIFAGRASRGMVRHKERLV